MSELTEKIRSHNEGWKTGTTAEIKKRESLLLEQGAEVISEADIVKRLHPEAAPLLDDRFYYCDVDDICGLWSVAVDVRRPIIKKVHSFLLQAFGWLFCLGFCACITLVILLCCRVIPEGIAGTVAFTWVISIGSLLVLAGISSLIKHKGRRKVMLYKVLDYSGYVPEKAIQMIEKIQQVGSALVFCVASAQNPLLVAYDPHTKKYWLLFSWEGDGSEGDGEEKVVEAEDEERFIFTPAMRQQMLRYLSDNSMPESVTDQKFKQFCTSFRVEFDVTFPVRVIYDKMKWMDENSDAFPGKEGKPH